MEIFGTSLYVIRLEANILFLRFRVEYLKAFFV